MTTAITGEPVGEHRVAVTVRAHELVPYARVLLERGYRVALIAGHDDGDALRVVYLFTTAGPDHRVELHLSLRPGRPARAQPGRAVLPRRPVRTGNQGPVRDRARRSPDAQPAGPAFPLAPRLAPDAPRRRRPTAVRRRRRPLPVPHRRGRGGLRDPRRPGARRDDRTRPLPVLRRRRNHPEPEGTALVRAPRHRETLRGPHPCRRDRTGRTGQRGHLRRPRAGVLPGRRGRLRRADLPCHTTDSGRSCSNWNGCTTTSTTSAHCATTSATAS